MEKKETISSPDNLLLKDPDDKNGKLKKSLDNLEITLKNRIKKTPKMIKEWLLSGVIVFQLLTGCAPKEKEYIVNSGETFSSIVTAHVKQTIDSTYAPTTDYDFHQKLLTAIQEDNQDDGRLKNPASIHPWDKIVINNKVVAQVFEDALKEKKKEKKKEEKIEKVEETKNVSAWPTVEQSRQRFMSWKKYFLEEYETQWNKKILDIYNGVPSPKMHIIESGKKSWNVIQSVGKVILHSTAWAYDESKIEQQAKWIYAHFLISEWGKIIQIKRNWALRSMTHAGSALWWDLNSQYFANHSIGIEVEADAGKEWSNDQYNAIQSLLKWIAQRYNPELKVSDILTHSQIGYEPKFNTRGRKSDPYFVNRPKLKLPNNYVLYDPNVAKGKVNSNLSAIQKSYPKTHCTNMTIWLRESKKIAEKKK